MIIWPRIQLLNTYKKIKHESVTALKKKKQVEDIKLYLLYKENHSERQKNMFASTFQLYVSIFVVDQHLI